jgi:hypothetical protein
MCRIAMIGERSKLDSPEFDIHSCLQCDLTITIAPANSSRAADQM